MSLKITSTATCIRTYQQLIFTGMRKDIIILILNYPWTSNQKHLWSIRIQRKTTRNFKVQQEWTKFFLEYWLELPLTVYLQLGCTHLDSCPHPVDVQKKCVVSIERIQLIKCHSEVSYSQNVHTIYNREKQTNKKIERNIFQNEAIKNLLKSNFWNFWSHIFWHFLAAWIKKERCYHSYKAKLKQS